MRTLRLLALLGAMSCVRPAAPAAPAPAPDATLDAGRAPNTVPPVVPGAFDRIPDARGEAAMETPGPAPAAVMREVRDSLLVSVLITADRRPDPATLRVSAPLSPAATQALRAWILGASYSVPLRGGQPMPAPFIFAARRTADGRLVARTLSAGGTTRILARPGDLSPSQLREAARQAHRLVSNVDTLHLRVGDTVTFDAHLRVQVQDSTGRTLGSIAMFDAGMHGLGVLRLGMNSVSGHAPGIDSVRLAWPRTLWTGRTDPPLTFILTVAVTRDGPRTPPLTPIPRPD